MEILKDKEETTEKGFNLQEALAEYQFLSGLYEALMRQWSQNIARLQKSQGKHIQALTLKEKLKHDMEILQPKMQALHDALLAHYKEAWGVKEFKFI